MKNNLTYFLINYQDSTTLRNNYPNYNCEKNSENPLNLWSTGDSSTWTISTLSNEQTDRQTDGGEHISSSAPVAITKKN